jgi:hypothetical protein
VHDYATQRRLGAPDQAGQMAVTLELEAFDLRVLGAEQRPARRPGATF